MWQVRVGPTLGGVKNTAPFIPNLPFVVGGTLHVEEGIQDLVRLHSQSVIFIWNKFISVIIII